MKGKVTKKFDGSWVIRTKSKETHPCPSVVEHGYEFPLHPDDVKQINADAQVFDNIEARIAAYPEVEFEIARYCKYHNSDPSKNSVCTLDCGYEEVSYAKLKQQN